MYSSILVPIDGSATAARGLAEAIGLARGLKAGLVLLNVVNDFPVLMEMAAAVNYAEVLEELRKNGAEVLAQGREQVQAAGVQCEVVLREVPSGRAADAIIEEARTRRCDLIVMGTHGRRGLSRLAMGSDAELVVRGAPAPVLLVRNPHASAS
ncbi:universal stress protein [Azohydromonas caseinilytica]|uniref:Universal stress protein n=1 Tax=Azohydromonas caseinilytica TaxID=2728836 RepID=A0A848FH93_9BURK|nr:universal stress protein [Azohydromonas caseinilytica]NML17659.1 universal stress protein [Azohydromonas caseinilytica]